MKITYRNIEWTWMGHTVTGAYYWRRASGALVGPYISAQAAAVAASVLRAWQV